jgi:hypothetical protein
MYCAVPRNQIACLSRNLSRGCIPTVAYLGWVGPDLYRYIHMSVGACMLDSGTVCGVPRCTTPAYAYLMCIVRTGTGTDLLGSAYRYRPDRKCVPVPVPT